MNRFRIFGIVLGVLTTTSLAFVRVPAGTAVHDQKAHKDNRSGEQKTQLNVFIPDSVLPTTRDHSSGQDFQFVRTIGQFITNHAVQFVRNEGALVTRFFRILFATLISANAP